MKKVLLINDSKFECFILKDILNSLGYDTEVGDEYNALKLAKSINPELVIANYIMKEIRGDQLISLIKVQQPNVRCILSSSNNIKIDDFHNKRIDAVFHTPIDKVELARLINGILEAGKTVAKENQEKPDAVEKAASKGKVVSPEPAISASVTHIPLAHAPVEKAHFCPYCGHDLDASKGGRFAFCPFCGQKL